MYVPDRNPVKWNGTFFMMSNQYCHFSCQPTPSKLTTMNCGAFSPGFSFLGTNPSGSAPAGVPADVVALLGSGLVVGLPEDEYLVVASLLPVDVAAVEPGVGLAVTNMLLVIVIAASSGLEVQAETMRAADIATAATLARVFHDRLVTNPPVASLADQLSVDE